MQHRLPLPEMIDKTFLASWNAAPSLGVDSYIPKFCSFKRLSSLAGIPVICAISSAVSRARINGEYKISFIASPSSIIFLPSVRACSLPSAVSAISVAPQILFSTFQMVWPCLVKYMCAISPILSDLKSLPTYFIKYTILSNTKIKRSPYLLLSNDTTTALLLFNIQFFSSFPDLSSVQILWS